MATSRGYTIERCDSLGRGAPDSLIAPLCSPLWALWLLAASAAPPPRAAADPTIAAPSTESDGAAVRVLVDTVVIDRRGTWSAGSDQADLIPGAPGVLKKSIELQAKDARRTKEAIELEARLVPQVQEPGGPACLLTVSVETRAASAAPASVHGRGRSLGSVSSSLALKAGEERLVDAYISPKTGGKVALRVRCDTARHEGTTRSISSRSISRWNGASKASRPRSWATSSWWRCSGARSR
jgi:hypothetical protein